MKPGDTVWIKRSKGKWAPIEFRRAVSSRIWKVRALVKGAPICTALRSNIRTAEEYARVLLMQ